MELLTFEYNESSSIFECKGMEWSFVMLENGEDTED